MPTYPVPIGHSIDLFDTLYRACVPRVVGFCYNCVFQTEPGCSPRRCIDRRYMSDEVDGATYEQQRYHRIFRPMNDVDYTLDGREAPGAVFEPIRDQKPPPQKQKWTTTTRGLALPLPK